MDPVTSRVLIADDDPGIIAVVEASLADENFELVTALDGEEALEAISAHRPDVVLLDLMMPRVDGMEVCRRIRKNPSTSDMCVIMLTARTYPADQLMGLRVGADDYITKPFDPFELPTRIRAALQRSREASALSSLTHLPGRRQMQDIQDRLLEEGSPFAVMSIDFDDFATFNDRYGSLRGDMAIRRLASCVQQVIAGVGGSRGFVGHRGGDDLVAVVDAPVVEAAARELIALWDRVAVDVYDAEDAERGFIDLSGSRGPRRSPLMALSIGIALGGTDAGEARVDPFERADEMRRIAKATTDSRFHIYAEEGTGGGRGEREGESLAPAASDDPGDIEPERPPLLRRARRAGPVKVWDQVAVLAEEQLAGKRETWLIEHPRTVVIVDDDSGVRDVLRVHCETQGFSVLGEAADGAEGVLRVGELQPAFVILDYRMPRMDGEEAAARIRVIHPDAKIVAFSGLLTGRPTWADDFLDKEQISQVGSLLGDMLDLSANRSAHPVT